MEVDIGEAIQEMHDCLSDESLVVNQQNHRRIFVTQDI
jgi:hypothetical protein